MTSAYSTIATLTTPACAACCCNHSLQVVVARLWQSVGHHRTVSPAARLLSWGTSRVVTSPSPTCTALTPLRNAASVLTVARRLACTAVGLQRGPAVPAFLQEGQRGTCAALAHRLGRVARACVDSANNTCGAHCSHTCAMAGMSGVGAEGYITGTGHL
jgi:hypothetical protein